MHKCKNIECNVMLEDSDKKVYCSLTCRSYYVNKYLRDYSKIKQTLNENSKQKQKEYYKNPNYCKHCNKILKYSKKEGKFCNHSCSASCTNKNRKGYTYNLSKEGRDSLIKSAYKNFNPIYGVYNSKEYHEKLLKEYNKNPSYCKVCNKKLSYKKK